MIRTGAMVPGPRTIARSSTLRRVLLVLIAAMTVVGCGPSAPPSGSNAAPASGVGLVSPEPSGRWPANVVSAVLALGAADGELQKAGTDLQKAADTQDLAAMRGAADGLATLIDKLTPLIERLESYPVTAQAGSLYRTAFPQLGTGAKQLRDAIAQGDAAAILAGTQQIARGLAAYADARREIGPLVDQAILQQRLLVK